MEIWLTDLWHRVWPWRIVLRDDWTELVAMNDDLLKQNWELSDDLAAAREEAELRMNMLYEASFDVFNGPRRDWGAFNKERQQEWLEYLEEEVRQSEVVPDAL